jgi:hypothetical protein
VLVTLLAALALAGTGCGGKERPGELEARLGDTAVAVCDGECTTYQATSAVCEPDGTQIDGRTYHACRVDYGEGGSEVVCAALGADGGHVARPATDC